MQIDPYFSHGTKLYSKWMKDLDIRPDTLNLTEEKVGNSLEFIVTGKKLSKQNIDCTGTKNKN